MERQILCECIAKRTKVMFEGSFYIPQAYILRTKAGRWIHSAELRDLKSPHSVIIAPLDRIALV